MIKNGVCDQAYMPDTGGLVYCERGEDGEHRPHQGCSGVLVYEWSGDGRRMCTVDDTGHPVEVVDG